MLWEAYKTPSGRWHEDRFRPLLSAMANLIMNIFLVKVIGLYGILISTVLSYVFINLPWLLERVFRDVFNEQNIKEYIIYFLKLTSIIILVTVISAVFCNMVSLNNLLMTLTIRLVVCLFLSSSVYIILTMHTPEFKRCLNIIRRR